MFLELKKSNNRLCPKGNKVNRAVVGFFEHNMFTNKRTFT